LTSPLPHLPANYFFPASGESLQHRIHSSTVGLASPVGTQLRRLIIEGNWSVDRFRGFRI
ncbi:hypothetical protein LINPERPRIM_LOCUS2340, partial [Linum perenne]